MGRSHALTGWCAGLAVAPALGQQGLAGALLVATVTSGFALLPDLDHRSSTASRLLGPVTGALSWLVRKTSTVIYELTKGPRDEDGSEHRTWWHTGLAAALLGVATAVGTTAGGRWAVVGVVVLGILLAVAALGDRMLIPAAAATGLLFVAAKGDLDGLAAELDDVAGWLGYAVALGCLVHDLGDALTESGCPILFPIPISGETYYEVRPPGLLRFTTGGIAEKGLFYVVFVPAAVLLIPGVWPLVWPVVTEHLT